MNLPKTVAGQIEIVEALVSAGLITPKDALAILDGTYGIPDEVLNSPLWKAMNEEK